MSETINDGLPQPTSLPAGYEPTQEYAIGLRYTPNIAAEMVPSRAGDWVKFADFGDLQARLKASETALVAEREKTRALLVECDGLKVCDEILREDYADAVRERRAAEAKIAATRDRLETIITKDRRGCWFTREEYGRPIVVQGETEFMTLKEARRLLAEMTDELRAVHAALSSVSDVDLAAARSPQTTAEPTA